MHKRYSLLMVSALSIAAISGLTATSASADVTGARSCAYGQDAYTAGGWYKSSFSSTIIHKQTRAGETRMSGLYTTAGQTRLWSAGWQSFSSSEVGTGTAPDISYTGCY